MTGEYRKYKQASKTLAKEGLDNFELTKDVMPTITGKVPLFSRRGLKILKVYLLYSISKKTPEEKLFAKKLELDKLTKLETQNYRNLMGTAYPANEKALAKYEKWKHVTKLIDKTKNRIAKLEKRIKP